MCVKCINQNGFILFRVSEKNIRYLNSRVDIFLEVSHSPEHSRDKANLLYVMFILLKVVSAILGRDINDHVHLIFPHDPLAASVGSLCSEIVHKNKWYYQPIKTNINSIPTNQGQGRVLWDFALRSG